MPLLIHEEAFDHLRFGDAAAMMLVLFLGVAALLFLVYVTVRGWGYEDDA
jgi:ABC-type sugar transport system permease subunit